MKPNLPFWKSRRLLMRLNHSLKKKINKNYDEFEAVEYKTQVAARINYCK